MKKLIAVLPLLATLSVSAIDQKVYSFMAPNVVSFIVSNNVGITNLNSVAAGAFPGAVSSQTNYFGLYTNTAKMGWLFWTSAPPITVAGLPTLGTLNILTNNTAVNPGTNASGVVTNGINVIGTTNGSTLNFFQDVPIESTSFAQDDQGLPGGAGLTNIIGVITIRSWANFFNVIGSANAGSNIVNLVFNPVVLDLRNNVAYEPTIASANNIGPSFTVSYTNQAGVYGVSSSDALFPTVFCAQIPRYRVAGFNGLRLQQVYSGNTTNAVWIDTVKFNRWSP